MGAPSPRYTAEFKQKAVELYKKSGTTYAEVARGLDCDARGLSDWVKKADAADCGAGDDPFQMAEDPRRLKRRRPQHGAVRRHRLREDPAGPAAPGAGDGHMVEAGSGLSRGPGHRRRAGRRGAEDGPGQEKQPERMRASFGSRSPVRVAAAVQDHSRARRAPVHGLDILAVGQRGHGAAHGHREVGVHDARACATREEAALDIFEYIEAVYSRARIHSAPGYMSPVESEEANWPDDEGRPRAA